MTIYKKIIENLANNPTQILIETETQKYTKAQFAQKIQQITDVIQVHQLENKIIGLSVPRSFEQIAAIVAIHLSGMAYTPIDIALPSKIREYEINNTNLEAVITTSQQADRFQESNLKIICIDSLTSSPTSLLDTSKIDSSDPAFIIHTSGTTSNPKGVIISHRALDNFVNAAIQAYQITNQDRYLQFSSINFDSSIEEIFPILVQDGVLVLRNKDFISSYENFYNYCTEKEITKLSLTTAYWNVIIENYHPPQHKFPPNIQTIILGGEKANPKILKKWQSYHLKTKLLNSYGPTETTVVALVADISNDLNNNQNYGEVAIGKPIKGYQVFLLDTNQKQVKPGDIGEIYIGGPSVADGYLNLPEKTAASFQTITINQKAQRLYKTGDLARQRLDGNFEFVGRADRQVKFNGYRIEPTQIENALITIPEIEDCVVFLDNNELMGDQLYAVYRGQEMEIAQIRKELIKLIPTYMVPTQLFHLEKFPLTLNGKKDVKKIKAMVLNHHLEKSSLSQEFTPTQKIVAEIWKKYLNRNQINLDDNFFNIGGHSLLIVRMMPELNQVLGQQIPLATMLEAPTLKEFTEQIEKKSISNTKNIYTLSDNQAQQNLFFVHGVGGDIIQYQPFADKISPTINVYGIRATGLDSQQPPVADINQLVDQYYSQIKQIQPTGPYYLVGHSLGGLFIYAIAKHIQYQGQNATIFMIDSEIFSNIDDFKKAQLPNYAKYMIEAKKVFSTTKLVDNQLHYQKTTIVEKSVNFIKKLFSKALKLIVLPWPQKWMFIKRQTNDLFDRDPKNSILSTATYQHVYQANTWMQTHYKLAPINAKAYIFHIERETSYLYPIIWQYLTPNQHTIIKVPGSHRTIMHSPNIDIITKKINQVISTTKEGTKDEKSN